MVRRRAISKADSARGIEFIGFDRDTAAMIFSRYEFRDPSSPDHLTDFVRRHIDELKDESNGWSKTSTPAQAMTRLGISQYIQDAILHPQFEILYKTESLHYWLTDTLRSNYWTLQQMLRNAPGNGASTRLNAEHFKETTKALPPDHTVLYRGQSAVELDQELRQVIQEDGRLDLSRIWDDGHGDFNHQRATTYFTPQHETAELWRAYMAKRCKYTETWLIMIQVPNTFLASLGQKELWYRQNG